MYVSVTFSSFLSSSMVFSQQTSKMIQINTYILVFQTISERISLNQITVIFALALNCVMSRKVLWLWRQLSKPQKKTARQLILRQKYQKKCGNHSLKPRRKLLFLNHEARGSCSWSKILCSLNIVCTNPSSNHVF